MKYCTITTVAMLALLLTGCQNESAANKDETPQTASGETAALPTDLFTEEAPADARAVGDLKADLDTTGDVVVHGRIGGRVEPFLDNAAVFLLADASMKSCDELHGDSCPTPWDYCCEPRDSLTAKTATVQVVDDAGKPLKLGLKGAHGLEPSAYVTIAGEIAPRAGTETLVINAKEIYVHTAGG